MEKFKNPFNDCIDFFSYIEKENLLPQIIFFTSQDSYEFEIMIQRYKNLLKDNLEVIPMVGETGDFEKLYTELINIDMFSRPKLYVITKGTQFFKNITSKAKKKLVLSFKNILSDLDQDKTILIHYDHWETPSSILNIFGSKLYHIKSKQFFPNEYKKKLQQILKKLKFKIEDEKAIELFVNRTPPFTGPYIKNLEKLKLYLNKRNFSLDDIQTVLHQFSDINFNILVNAFFENKRITFHREIAKFQEKKDNWIYFLNLLLKKLNLVRKFKCLDRLKNNQEFTEKEFYEILGFSSNYSPQRKSFLINSLKKEANLFNEDLIEKLYQFCIDTNIKIKTSGNKDNITLYIKNQIDSFFIQMNH